MNITAPPVRRHPIRIFIGLLLGITGIAASIATIYATPAEGLPKLSCGLEALDCSTALKSEYSSIAGIPLGVFGVFYFTFWTLNLRAFQRTDDGVYRWFVSWITMLGAICSLTLGTIMFFVLEAPCLYCLITHLSNIGAVIILWPILRWRVTALPRGDHFWHFLSLSAIALLAAIALGLASDNRDLRAQLEDALEQAAPTPTFYTY